MTENIYCDRKYFQRYGIFASDKRKCLMLQYLLWQELFNLTRNFPTTRNISCDKNVIFTLTGNICSNIKYLLWHEIFTVTRNIFLTGIIFSDRKYWFWQEIFPVTGIISCEKKFMCQEIIHVTRNSSYDKK